jgi:hypothetical protein
VLRNFAVNTGWRWGTISTDTPSVTWLVAAARYANTASGSSMCSGT